VNPLVFGFIPIGLSYHACYTIATAGVMWLLVKYAWPSHLEEGHGDGETGGLGATVSSRPVAQSPRRPVTSSEEGSQR
jgi:hypothetical protein